MYVLTNTEGMRFSSVMAPVSADLAAEVASQPVHSAANVSQLLLGSEAFDVPTVPQDPSSHRHQHQQSPCKMSEKVHQLAHSCFHRKRMTKY